MALVTVQRSPSPSNTPDSLSSDLGQDVLDATWESDTSPRSPNKSRSKHLAKKLQKYLITLRFIRPPRFSESYFAVKGAALILPQSECPRTVTKGSHGGDIQTHLQSMFYLLRQQDTIKVAVKLESMLCTRIRYMAVVSTLGRQDTEESIILGIDIVEQRATIGLVLPIWSGTIIRLDGDGGFSVTSIDKHHIFKPVSVQAMWSALQSLIKARDVACSQRYFPQGLTHTWVTYYEANIHSDQTSINEWNVMEDIESHRVDPALNTESDEKVALEKTIKAKLKDIMMQVDLEEVTSKVLRCRLEQELGMDLKAFRHFIDEEMIIILRQMDSPTEIFDHLYLGSEWNASNLEELKENGVGYILNVTREIDNFFPGIFQYQNIRVFDVEQSDLLKHWEETYKFITKAKNAKSKVLVHCKMGVSRSASTVIAYAMKECDFSFEEAYDHVKKRRSCIKPNKGFLQQLITYQGILDASRQRHNLLWRSRSTGNLMDIGMREVDNQQNTMIESMAMNIPQDLASPGNRPRSWSPEDNTAQLLLKTRDLASDDDSSEADNAMTGDPYYQEEPVHPAFFSWDDIDDIEMSSRSADSIDEVETAVHSQRRSDFYNTECPPVVLLSHKTLNRDIELDSDAVPADADADAESEVDDVVAEENAGRPEKGFYDVSMFYVNLAPSETGLTTDDEEEKHELNYYLHPDYKIELLFAQQRKHRHIAQLLKLSEKGLKVPSPTSVPLINLEPDNQVPPQTLIVTKLRADSSWIKPVEQISEQATQPIQFVEGISESTPLIGTAQLLNDATVDESSTDVVEDVSQLPDSPSTTDVVSTEQSEKQSAPSEPVLQYQKEEIPWNKGTVKNYTKDYEQKLQSTEGKGEKRARKESSSSGECSSSSSDEACDEKQGAVVPDISSPLADATQSPVDTAPATRPTSIYESEDIPFEPGIVLRTKQEIEGRRESCEQAAEVSIQRSSSLKDDRNSKKDRNSERRRTCLPVLQSSPGREEGSDTSLSSSSTPGHDAEVACISSNDTIPEDDGERRVFHIGSEDVPLPVGLVVKLHREYSERDKGEIESRDRAQSPLEEEGLDIPCGSVRRQLENIQKTYKIPPVADAGKSPVFSSDLTSKPVSTMTSAAPVSTHTKHKTAQTKTDATSPPVACATSLTTPVMTKSTVSTTSINLTKPSTTGQSEAAMPSFQVQKTSAQPSLRVTSTGVDSSNTKCKTVPTIKIASTEESVKDLNAIKTVINLTENSVTSTDIFTGSILKPNTVSASKTVLGEKSEQGIEQTGGCRTMKTDSAASGIKQEHDCTGKESQTPDISSVYKEDIQWNMGTVRQQKAALESKFKFEQPASNSRLETQCQESGPASSKETSLHITQSHTTTAANEKLTVSLSTKNPSEKPGLPEEKHRRLVIIEKNPSPHTSPLPAKHPVEPETNVSLKPKYEIKGTDSKITFDIKTSLTQIPPENSSQLTRSHSMRESKSKVVLRPRSNTDTTDTSAPVTPLYPISPSTAVAASPDTSPEDNDSEHSEKSDAQSVKDLLGFFETKDVAVLDRTKRPCSLHGTDGSASQKHKKASMTRSLDSNSAESLTGKDSTQQVSTELKSPLKLDHTEDTTGKPQSAGQTRSQSTPVSPTKLGKLPVSAVSQETSETVKTRRQHGKSHPLTRLAQDISSSTHSRDHSHSGQSSNPVF